MHLKHLPDAFQCFRLRRRTLRTTIRVDRSPMSRASGGKPGIGGGGVVVVVVVLLMVKVVEAAQLVAPTSLSAKVQTT